MNTIVTLILSLISYGLLAQAKMYIPEKDFQFDTMQQGDLCEHDFMVINVGNEPLIFTNVKTGCGCDVPSWKKDPVMPGDTTYVHYKYDSNRVGIFHKTMTIQSNALGQEVFAIKIKGCVRPKED